MSDFEVFVDMDGPLANFEKFLETHPDVLRLREGGSDHEVSWQYIWKEYPEIFLNLEVAVGYKDLWNVAVDMDKNNDPIVITAISTVDPYKGTWQKQYWLWKIFGATCPPVICCLRSHKKDYARKNRILIDDSDQNISEWIKEGGIGVLYRDHKQAIEELKFIADTC